MLLLGLFIVWIWTVVKLCRPELAFGTVFKLCLGPSGDSDSSFLPRHIVVMAQVVGYLPPTWETSTEFQIRVSF